MVTSANWRKPFVLADHFWVRDSITGLAQKGRGESARKVRVNQGSRHTNRRCRIAWHDRNFLVLAVGTTLPAVILRAQARIHTT